MGTGLRPPRDSGTRPGRLLAIANNRQFFKALTWRPPANLFLFCLRLIINIVPLRTRSKENTFYENSNARVPSRSLNAIVGHKVGVFVKAPAVTVLNARPGTGSAGRLVAAA